MRVLWLVIGLMVFTASQAAVRIKELGRIDGIHDDVILGYGLVVGLSGTGDTQRSRATLQSVSNLLREFGLQVPPQDVSSRNVAAVMVTARILGFLRAGDRLDVNVSAMGDARSLAGGTLLAAPLVGTNREVYALAQGALSIGGFRYEQNGTISQKNHPTSGIIPDGAIAKRSLSPELLKKDGTLDLVLNEPDFTTAARVAAAVNREFAGASATPIEAGRIRLKPAGTAQPNLIDFIAAVESLSVEPDIKARVVVNERTGTIVSGGDVWISEVTVSQGDIRVAITQRFLVSQPDGGVLIDPGAGIRTAVVPESKVDVRESDVQTINLPQGATIAELADALRKIRASSRDVIAILQGIKRAGALHADLIIQ